MSRHLADKRSPSQGARLKHFLRIEREVPRSWHRSHGQSGAARLKQFLRIARGRVA